MPDFDVSSNYILILLPFFKVFLSLFFFFFPFFLFFLSACTNRTMPVMLRLTKALNLSQDFKTRYPKCAIASAQINNQ